MKPGTLAAQRLLALFAGGWLLFNYPLLSLLGSLRAAGGIPALYLYPFLAWAVLIGLIALVVESAADDDGD